MRTDLKIGIAVGLFVAVIVVVYFVFGSGSFAPLAQPDKPPDLAYKPGEHNRPEKLGPGESTPGEPLATVGPVDRDTEQFDYPKLDTGTPDSTEPKEVPAPVEDPKATTPEAPKPGESELAWVKRTRVKADVRPKPVEPFYAKSPVPAAPIYHPVSPLREQPRPITSTVVGQAYVVRSGDAGFWGIAKKVYGKGKYHYLLAQANPGADTNNLRPGQVLRCPPKPVETVAPPSDALPAASAKDVYVVLEGDAGFWGIAKKVYGKGKYFYVIARANPGADTNRLKPGERLRVPPLTSGGTVPVVTPSLPGSPRAIPARGIYVVKEGDQGFWGVAKKVYRDGKYMDVIAKANPGVDPRRLRPGQKLNAPELTAELLASYRRAPVRDTVPAAPRVPAEPSDEPRPYFAEYASQ